MIYNQDGIQEAIGLFFDVENNLFIDEDGFYVWNIYEIITPNDLMVFKSTADDRSSVPFVVKHRTFKEIAVELYFPDDGWPDYDNQGASIRNLENIYMKGALTNES